MTTGFSFEGALMFPFCAAHARTFPWIFALAFAVVQTVMGGLFMYLGRDAVLSMFDAVNTLSAATEHSPGDEQAAMAALGGMFEAVMGLLRQTWPLLILGTLASWVIWVMFEAASQRRYIRDEAFSLRFGADEVHMLGTSFFWFLLQGVVMAIPVLSMFSAFGAAAAFVNDNISQEAFAGRFIGGIAVSMLAFLVLFPVYIFFATRFSPCFGLTIKDRKVAFLDAWAASRGRFWPILGAYVIIAIAGGVVASVANSISEMVLMPTMLSSPFLDGDLPDFRNLLTPGFLAAMSFYLFVQYFTSGLLMHIADGPAAFAARHDPSGGVDDALRVTEFD